MSIASLLLALICLLPAPAFAQSDDDAQVGAVQARADEIFREVLRHQKPVAEIKDECRRLKLLEGVVRVDEAEKGFSVLLRNGKRRWIAVELEWGPKGRPIGFPWPPPELQQTGEPDEAAEPEPAPSPSPTSTPPSMPTDPAKKAWIEAYNRAKDAERARMVTESVEAVSRVCADARKSARTDAEAVELALKKVLTLPSVREARPYQSFIVVVHFNGLEEQVPLIARPPSSAPATSSRGF
jgi:hypothetical protein